LFYKLHIMLKENPERVTDVSTGRRDIAMIDPRIIKVEPGHNPRDYSLSQNRDHLDELKANIRENGVLQALLVRWETGSKQVYLVDGESRLKSCMELIEEGVEIISIPCQQVRAGNEADRLIIALTANTGKPLSKWEEGGAFKRLLGFGYDTDRIVLKMGYKKSYVEQALELADASQDVKELLSTEAITPSLAISHLREHGDAAPETLKKVVRKVRKAAKAAGLDPDQAVAKRARAKNSGIKITQECYDAIKLALEDAVTTKDATTANLAQAAWDLFSKVK